MVWIFCGSCIADVTASGHARGLWRRSGPGSWGCAPPPPAPGWRHPGTAPMERGGGQESGPLGLEDRRSTPIQPPIATSHLSRPLTSWPEGDATRNGRKASGIDPKPGAFVSPLWAQRRRPLRGDGANSPLPFPPTPNRVARTRGAGEMEKAFFSLS